MGLPDIISIHPPSRPVRAGISVPGSKSITNRALILAALASGRTVLKGALWSEDTQVMVDCLRLLGFGIQVEADALVACNRTIVIDGLAGRVPPGGTRENPMELFVGNAGTAARFLAATLCLGSGVYRLHGVPRMHERPQKALFEALRQLGYRIESTGDKLPALIHGAGPRPGSCSVSVKESSQFASALYLAAERGGWQVQTSGDNDEESRYVTMTTQMVGGFPRTGGDFVVEPDASSGSYFQAAHILMNLAGRSQDGSKGLENAVFSDIHVAQWPVSGWQMDAAFAKYWPLPDHVSRQRDLGDSIMTAMILAPFGFGSKTTRFEDLGRLRVQECERVAAMRTELTRCGARVEETGDTLTIWPSKMHGAEINTYGDHRMAMCFATLGLVVPGMRILEPVCVKKTFPNYFQILVCEPPNGLGATIMNARTGLILSEKDLFAE
jgi:3-phosphoshikimate 1-carboxyvinyltransferase